MSPTRHRDHTKIDKTRPERSTSVVVSRSNGLRRRREPRHVPSLSRTFRLWCLGGDSPVTGRCPPGASTRAPARLRHEVAPTSSHLPGHPAAGRGGARTARRSRPGDAETAAATNESVGADKFHPFRDGVSLRARHFGVQGCRQTPRGTSWCPRTSLEEPPCLNPLSPIPPPRTRSARRRIPRRRPPQSRPPRHPPVAGC